MWRYILEALQDDEELLQAAPFFFRRTADAYLDGATLRMHRLIDRTKKSTSIFYFLRFVAKHPEIFQYVTTDEVVEAADQSREMLESKKKKLDSFLMQRNKHFVHLAREYLLLPDRDVYKEFPTTYEDLFGLLTSIGEILNRFSGFYDQRATLLEFWDERTSIESLFRYLRLGFDDESRELDERFSKGRPEL